MATIIHIDVHPQEFTFRNPKSDCFELKTVLHLFQKKGQWKVGAIGTWEDRPPNVLSVRLFENDDELPDAINKQELLTLFITYGIGKSLQ